MDIIERLRLVDITFWWKPLGGGVDTELDVPAYELGALSHKAADEIERLRKELVYHQEKTRAAYMRDARWISNISNAKDEIEQLREALREIHGLGDTPDDSWKAYQICCKALGEED